MKGEYIVLGATIVGVILLFSGVIFLVAGVAFTPRLVSKKLYDDVGLLTREMNGTKSIEFRVTEKGHVYVYVVGDPRAPAFVLYSPYISTSSDGSPWNGTYNSSADLEPGIYYAVLRFEMTNGDPGVSVIIGWSNLEPNPYLMPAILMLATGTSLIILGMVRRTQKRENSVEMRA
jgi:hypothetical protein